MERTYHPTIDNGLFFLAEILNKSYKDITIEDIKESSEVVAEMIIKYKEYVVFKKNTLNGFQNSLVNNNSIKNKDQVIKHILDMFDNIGNGVTDDTCMFCGKKLVKYNRTSDYKKKPTRSYMPQLSSMQFSNFTNNLQVVNVCPICLYLSILSSFVCKSYGSRISLFMSDNDAFMEFISSDAYQYIETRLLGIDKKFSSMNSFLLEELCDLVVKTNIYDNAGYIQVINLCNSSKLTPEYRTSMLHKDDFMFIKNLLSKNLIDEFKSDKCRLVNSLINGKLSKNYTFYVMNNFKNISKDLFNAVEEVYCKMNDKKIKLIEKICNRIYSNNDKNEIKELERISKLGDFQEILIKWSKLYKTEEGKNFFDNSNEYDVLTDPKEFLTTKNRMIIQFMMLDE